MIKYCNTPHGKSLVDVAPSRGTLRGMPQMAELRRTSTPPIGTPQMVASSSNISHNNSPQVGASGTQSPYGRPHIHIAAIDNSLSFPHEHPKGWRSFTYGWLYLPVTVIGRPFSQKTRDHFLPLLTSKQWWADTTYELRKMFAIDPGFHPKMFNVSRATYFEDEPSQTFAPAATGSDQGASMEHRAVVEARGASCAFEHCSTPDV